MKCLMRTRVKTMVEHLAGEHRQELAAAGTFVDLTTRKDAGRQLRENEMTEWSDQAWTYYEYHRLRMRSQAVCFKSSNWIWYRRR